MHGAQVSEVNLELLFSATGRGATTDRYHIFQNIFDFRKHFEHFERRKESRERRGAAKLHRQNTKRKLSKRRGVFGGWARGQGPGDDDEMSDSGHSTQSASTGVGGLAPRAPGGQAMNVRSRTPRFRLRSSRLPETTPWREEHVVELEKYNPGFHPLPSYLPWPPSPPHLP